VTARLDSMAGALRLEAANLALESHDNRLESGNQRIETAVRCSLSGNRDLETVDHNSVSSELAIEEHFACSMSCRPIVLTRVRASLCPDVGSLSANVHHVSSSPGSMCRNLASR
jgi:hypothetical protein